MRCIGAMSEGPVFRKTTSVRNERSLTITGEVNGIICYLESCYTIVDIIALRKGKRGDPERLFLSTVAIR